MIKFLLNTRFRFRLLVSVWLVFAVLVLCGIHGSSVSMLKQVWRPEVPASHYTDYAFGFVTNFFSEKLTRGKTGELPRLLGCLPSAINSDEYLILTPWALSQAKHCPAFPVINTNIGCGQNMLIVRSMPVWHISTLARPTTWGYLIFGNERGLAWMWWFQIFGCFTALFLVFEILLRSERLAAFGAFWICASAYLVCWSLSPADVVMYPALATWSLLRLLQPARAYHHVLFGILLGLSLTAFVMFLYPTWQVSAGYFFGAVFLGIFIRDRLWQSFTSLKTSQVIGGGVALLFCAVTLGAFLNSTWPAIQAMSATAYPGRNPFSGGTLHPLLMMRGFFNLHSNEYTFGSYINPCELASFFYFFPALLCVVALSKKVRQQLDATGWCLLALLVLSLAYFFVGFPKIISQTLQINYLYRPDLILGLTSLAFSVVFLKISSEVQLSKRTLFIGTALMTILVLLTGLWLIKETGSKNTLNQSLLMAAIAGGLTYFLLAGQRRIFICGVSAFAICTSGWFNPLTRNIPCIYDNEMAQTIQRINEHDGTQPLWLCYGPRSPGVLAYTVGARSLGGAHFHPQMNLWSKLDPTGKDNFFYNRYGYVQFTYTSDPTTVSFAENIRDVVDAFVHPLNPGLKELGVKYVLATDSQQEAIAATGLKLLYKSEAARFSVFVLDSETTPLK